MPNGEIRAALQGVDDHGAELLRRVGYIKDATRFVGHGATTPHPQSVRRIESRDAVTNAPLRDPITDPSVINHNAQGSWVAPFAPLFSVQR